MTFTFILACQNVLTRIDDCLAAIRRCARPGDSLVVVDDGSTDGTGEYLDRLALIGNIGLPCRTILLGTHSYSYNALPFRIGIEHALEITDSDAIVLVDGRDRLDPVEFFAARAHFERYKPDLLYANYAFLDPIASLALRPPDTPAWGRIHTVPHASLHERRVQALALHPAPWRVIYRTAFIQEAGLSFPVGLAGQEAAVFHWEACLTARSFAFLDRRICLRGVGSAAEGGGDFREDHLAAFIRICRLLSVGHSSPWEHSCASDAVAWLLTGMYRELERLEFDRCRAHAERACAALGTIPEDIWAMACSKLGTGHPIILVGNMIRSSSPVHVAAHWELLALRRETQVALGALYDLDEQIAGQVKAAVRVLQTLHEVTRFTALSEMLPSRRGRI